MHTVATFIRHAVVMNGEEERLFEDIEGTIASLYESGVNMRDCSRVKNLLETAIKTADFAEYVKCFEEFVKVLMPYVNELKSAWESICSRFGVERPFNAEAVSDLVEIFNDLESAMSKRGCVEWEST